MTDPAPAPNRVTLMLSAVAAGDSQAAEDLLPLVYEELRSLARSRLAKVPAGNTLQPTALVHEAYLRLVQSGSDETDPHWRHRGHFFGAAARAMRDILVEQARRKAGPKAGGGHARVNLDDAAEHTPLIEPPVSDILALNDALTRLEKLDPRKSDVVMLRYFAGLTNEQVALAMGVSLPTVERDWRFVRSWLQKELAFGPPSDKQDKGGGSGGNRGDGAGHG